MGKNPEIKKVLDNITTDMFGKSKSDAEAERVCVFCHKPIKDEDFRNEISRREYGISGICQKCQDDVFGKD